MLVGPQAMAVADLNGDGKVDLAVGGGVPQGVTVLLGKGDGTFATGGSYFGYHAPKSVAAADLNRDGKIDLVLADPGAYKLVVGLGSNDGTFSYTAEVGYALSAAPTSVAIADLNEDGVADLVAGTATTEARVDSSRVYAMLGNGDGTFQPAVTFEAEASPQSLVAADMNGDGQLDLVVANYDGASVSVLTLGSCSAAPAEPAPPSLCVIGNACSGSVLYTCGTPDISACNLTCDCSTSGLYCEEGCP